jgi:UDP-N-acetylglucosamine 2-epimerase (non-hydrolysing)
MTVKKVLLLVGTRPEVVKMAPVFHALREAENVEPLFCVSGQHDEMLHQALDAFDISPEANMNVMKAGQTLSELTSQILRGTTKLLEEVKPDAVLVHGDTTTAFAATLASFYSEIEVGHVEAGLRTFDLKGPFPEEANRQLISRLASWNFAPTSRAAQNLSQEGVSTESIFVTGNTVVDSLSFIAKKFQSNSDFLSAVRQSFANKAGFDCTEERTVLVTAHRRENLGEGMLEICRAIRELNGLYPTVKFVFPVHPNPLVRRVVEKELSGITAASLIDPLPYAELVFTLIHSELILTDSGGIQEEGVSLGRQVLVLREKTERPEGLESGFLTIVGPNAKEIVRVSREHLDRRSERSSSTTVNSTYGDGRAANRIAEVVATGNSKAWQRVPGALVSDEISDL